MTDNVTLTAQWEKIQYIITIVNNASNVAVSGIATGDTAYADDEKTFKITCNESSVRETKVTVTVNDVEVYSGTLGSWFDSFEATVTFTMPAAPATITIS